PGSRSALVEPLPPQGNEHSPAGGPGMIVDEIQITSAGRNVRSKQALAVLLFVTTVLTGCNVGPRYSRPPVETPPSYKELTHEKFKEVDGWKVAQPKDDTLRGKWWEIFSDPELNKLEEQINISNQNIAAAAAGFLAARALVHEARAQLFPTLTTTPS